MLNVLEDLFNLARQRKQNPVDGSYTNKLLNDKNLSKEKVIEEINELIQSVDKDSNKIQFYDKTNQSLLRTSVRIKLNFSIEYTA